MKYYLFVALTSCGLSIITYCPELKVSISSVDAINIVEDSNFGIGDDNLFSANELKFSSKMSHELNTNLEKLNDYNLQTAYQCVNFDTIKGDTIIAIADFSGLKNSSIDTAIIIQKLLIFNGNRKNISSWEYSGKVKELELYHKSECIGKAILYNTYKMQTIELGENKFPILSGTVDTIKLVVKSIYPSKNLLGYSLGEIKFEGIKNY